MLFRSTVLLTFGLGTALGDAAAINAGLGFDWSILLFGALIVIPFALWRLGLPAVGCFWASYALTRPLGASIADYLAAKPSGGGLGWGTGPVTAIGLVLFAALVAYVWRTGSDAEGTHEGALTPHGTDAPAVQAAAAHRSDATRL